MSFKYLFVLGCLFFPSLCYAQLELEEMFGVSYQGIQAADQFAQSTAVSSTPQKFLQASQNQTLTDVDSQVRVANFTPSTSGYPLRKAQITANASQNRTLGAQQIQSLVEVDSQVRVANLALSANGYPLLEPDTAASGSQLTVPAEAQSVLPQGPILHDQAIVADQTVYTDAAIISPETMFSPGAHLPAVEKPQIPLANQNADGQGLMFPYLEKGRILDASEQHSQFPQELPIGFQPWWSQQVRSGIGLKQSAMPLALDALLHAALQHSPHIQVAATEPHIRQSAVFEESARFDWVHFLESKYDDVNDPIGNTLTTGNNDDRFTQQEWFARGGARRKNRNGGEFEISQRIGFLDNNSRFLIPENQGNARLQLDYRQPLLRGRGRAVNESLIVLAEIDFRVTGDDFQDRLQEHLLRLTENYWELHRSRAQYLQRQRALRSAQEILQKLEGRSEVDALDRQIYSARAAVAKRGAEIARSIGSIKNAESQLRLLVNDPRLVSLFEYAPVDPPAQQSMQISMSDAVATALANRPDISKAIRDIRAANIRNGIARNEFLPKLDLLLESYVAGLDGDSGVLNSWVHQFKDGRPGFNFGFEWELPYGNRAAQAKVRRRQWEHTRAMQSFSAVMVTSITEVEVAVREIEIAHQEMIGRYQAMVAAHNQTEYLLDRWKTLPDPDESVTLLLENLLDSQVGLADEEASFSQAQFDYSIAIVRLKQTMGTLFRVVPNQAPNQ